jgi:hypothetical protein
MSWLTNAPRQIVAEGQGHHAGRNGSRIASTGTARPTLPIDWIDRSTKYRVVTLVQIEGLRHIGLPHDHCTARPDLLHKLAVSLIDLLSAWLNAQRGPQSRQRKAVLDTYRHAGERPWIRSRDRFRLLLRCFKPRLHQGIKPVVG